MNYLYFASSVAPDGTASSEEVACFPAHTISHLEMATATELRVYFTSTQEADADSGIDAAIAILTVASGKHKEAIKAITIAANNSLAANGGFVVVADAANSEFVDANITDCTLAIVDAS